MLLWLLIFMSAVYWTEARVTAEVCQVKPQEKHCLIEWASRERWPHMLRYTYDERTRKCFEIRWSNHCAAPMPDTNNFATESECMSECSGWA